MTERKLEGEGDLPMEEEIDVSTDDLDAAMQDALDAVERGEAEPSAVEPEGAPKAILEELEGRIAELRDRNVRTLADFENFRKRVERERSEMRRYEGFELLAEMLPVLDNLDLALEAGGSVEDLKTGVDLIAKQFRDLLRRHGVDRISSVGEAFDPTVHDAVSRDEDPDVEAPTVSEEFRAGYRMGERLLRPASVRVTTPPDGPADEAEPASPETLN